MDTLSFHLERVRHLPVIVALTFPICFGLPGFARSAVLHNIGSTSTFLWGTSSALVAGVGDAEMRCCTTGLGIGADFDEALRDGAGGGAFEIFG